MVSRELALPLGSGRGRGVDPKRHFGASRRCVRASLTRLSPAARDNGHVSETPELLVADAGGWRAWLAANHATSRGVRLVLAGKGVIEPTRLTYDDALPEALSYGWIDGHLTRRDEATYRVRFTPRRAGSSWSQRNVEIAERLISNGQMQPAGLVVVERAKADGRWEGPTAVRHPWRFLTSCATRSPRRYAHRRCGTC